MKDIQIKGKDLKRETSIFLLVFLTAFAINIYSIMQFKTSWGELYKELYIVVILAFVLYFLLWPVRLLAALLTRFIQREKH